MNDRVEDTVEDVQMGTQENRQTSMSNEAKSDPPADLVGAQSEGDLRQNNLNDEKEANFARHKSSNAI